ncbi:endonuclease/exonuclease/phosphatase family protein [Lunatibacter salilacus]|uniref:endonuclease/exonuclease/phosphatase family protein n=1 Tax=Lunatibacter salilacus TaxID=2483804 RepID=UPI00131B779D|nr:endonuclease/exonuclease/phosphatase family protein [Lunatibacter salilacus]
MKFFVYILSAISLIATGLPLIKSAKWWIRIFDFPRMSIAVFCLLALILCFRYIHPRKIYKIALISLLAVALVFQLSKIIFYTPLYPRQAKVSQNITEENRLSILVFNVRMENEETEKFVDLVKKWDPDMILITEPDSIWAEALSVLDKEYEFQIKEPLPNTYGMMFFSKFPLSEKKVRYLVEEEVPSIATKITLRTGDEVMLYGLHPRPPKPGSDTYERDTEILLVGKEVQESSIPSIVAGDLNDVAWSHTSELFQRYAQLIDPREGVGMFNTYNTSLPFFRYPLDHIFYSEEFGLTRMERLEHIGSDHFPIYIELTFEPEVDQSEFIEKVDEEAEEEVQETIEKGT